MYCFPLMETTANISCESGRRKVKMNRLAWTTLHRCWKSCLWYPRGTIVHIKPVVNRSYTAHRGTSFATLVQKTVEHRAQLVADVKSIATSARLNQTKSSLRSIMPCVAVWYIFTLFFQSGGAGARAGADPDRPFGFIPKKEPRGACAGSWPDAENPNSNHAHTHMWNAHLPSPSPSMHMSPAAEREGSGCFN